jgi:hypothetical protein
VSGRFVLGPCLVGLAVLAGCGGSDESRVIAPPRLDVRAVQRTPAGSPERALVELGRAVQVGDPVAVVAYLGPGWPHDPQVALRFLRIASPIVQSWGVPRVVGVLRDGPAATVRMRAGRTGYADMRRIGGRWRLVRFRIGSIRLPTRSLTRAAGG